MRAVRLDLAELGLQTLEQFLEEGLTLFPHGLYLGAVHHLDGRTTSFHTLYDSRVLEHLRHLRSKHQLSDLPAQPGPLLTTRYSRADPRLLVTAGGDTTARLWLGNVSISQLLSESRRGPRVGDETLDLKVRAGTNHLLVKVVNAGGGWGFAMDTWSRVPQTEIDAGAESEREREREP